MDILSLAMAKTYVSDTIKGIGAIKGDPGEKGEKPIKGVDYWTDADQEAIVSDVLSRIENGDEVSY